MPCTASHEHLQRGCFLHVCLERILTGCTGKQMDKNTEKGPLSPTHISLGAKATADAQHRYSCMYLDKRNLSMKAGGSLDCVHMSSAALGSVGCDLLDYAQN